MSYCMKCGAKNDEGNKYCEVCGAALEEDTFEKATLKGNAPEKTAPEEDTFEEITLKGNAPKNTVPMETIPWKDTETAKPAEDERKGLAIASLICGIVSLLCGCGGVLIIGVFGCCINFIVAVPAIVCGIISLAQKRGGKGMAITGLILGGLGLLLSIIAACIGLILILAADRF